MESVKIKLFEITGIPDHRSDPYTLSPSRRYVAPCPNEEKEVFP